MNRNTTIGVVVAVILVLLVIVFMNNQGGGDVNVNTTTPAAPAATAPAEPTAPAPAAPEPIEAAERISSSMRPLTIQRIGAGYHDPISDGLSIASATGIRKSFFEGGSLEELAHYLPAASLDALTAFKMENGRFGSWDAFYPMLRFIILRDKPQSLRQFAEVAEGIEYLIYEAAQKEQDFEAFIARIKSKRFTRTRIQRMLTHIFTGFTWQQLKSFEQPGYLRLLAHGGRVR